jgi:hypothetical protein
MDALSSTNLLTMGGMELTTFWGHALALGLREWVGWSTGEGARTMEQIAAEVEARGGVFIIGHPAHVGDPYCTGCQWVYPTMMPGNAHVVEAWNMKWSGESRNDDALNLIYGWLNQGHRLAFTSGTDNHGRNPNATHLAFNVVYADDLSEREILRAIRAGHSYLSSGARLDLTATSGDASALMGDALKVARAATVHVTAGWDDSPPAAELALIVDGVAKEKREVAANGSQAWELKGEDARWCLLTLRSSDQTMLAMTNPIYFDGRE